MDTYSTMDDARAAKGQIARYILQIDHRDRGICYIGSKVTLEYMRVCLARKPHPEIIRVISEHSVQTEEQQATDRERILKEMDDNRRCERCGCHVSDTAYHQPERSHRGPVMAYYCDSCKRLLTQIGAGEYTAVQERD